MRKYKTSIRLFFRYQLFMLMTASLLFSCQIERDVFQASFDVANQSQGGNSQDSNRDYEPGENLGLNVFAGMAHGVTHGNVNKTDIDTWGDMIDSKTMENNLLLMTGLQYIGKGYKSGSADAKASIHLNYLQVPLYGIYEHPLSSGYFFGGAGPYFAYGIGGKTKFGNFSESSFGENNGGYKRFDFGAGLLAGYRMEKGFSFFLSYELGLANIAYASQDFSAKNRVIGLNVSYDISNILMPHKN